MDRFRLFAIAAISSMASLCSSAWAAVVYTQPAQSPVVSARASQFVTPPGAFTFQTFDNFSLNADTSIGDVHWQGAYFNVLIPPTSAPIAPNATGFGVNFYADNAGLPGALLSTASFSPSGANESFVGNEFAPNLNVTLAIFDYDVVLSVPFLATAGTPYWLSVFAASPPPSATDAQWGWTGGTGGNGTSFQNGFAVNFDRAFSLTTTAVPEPPMIGLLTVALLVLFGVRRGGLSVLNR
jgi:hypothetical protein